MSYSRTSIRSLDDAIGFMSELRKLAPYLPTQAAECFLVIARNPGLTMQDLAKATGLAQSSCSRNVALLSAHHRLNKDGLGLVEAVSDPREGRRKIVFLTSKGSRKLLAVMRKMDPCFALSGITAAEGVAALRAGNSAVTPA